MQGRRSKSFHFPAVVSTAVIIDLQGKNAQSHSLWLAELRSEVFKSNGPLTEESSGGPAKNE